MNPENLQEETAENSEETTDTQKDDENGELLGENKTADQTKSTAENTKPDKDDPKADEIDYSKLNFGDDDKLLDDDTKNKFRSFAKENKLSPELFSKGYELFKSRNLEVVEKYKAQNKERTDSWEKENLQYLSVKSEEKKSNIATALNAGGKELNNSVRQTLQQFGLSSNPHLVKLFAEIGAKLQDDKGLNSEAGAGSGTKKNYEDIVRAELENQSKGE
jgi:hypothetical protein